MDWTPPSTEEWSKRNQQALQGLLNINQFLPVTGDIQSGILAAQDLENKQYGNAALNAVGLLPFLPAFGGVIKYPKESEEVKSFFDKVIGEHLTDLGYKQAILPNNNVKIYHGTSQKNANSILKSGEFKGFPFFTPDKEAAQKWAKQAGKKPTVLELEVNKSALSPTGGYLSARKEGLHRKPDGTWGYLEE